MIIIVKGKVPAATWDDRTWNNRAVDDQKWDETTEVADKMTDKAVDGLAIPKVTPKPVVTAMIITVHPHGVAIMTMRTVKMNAVVDVQWVAVMAGTADGSGTRKAMPKPVVIATTTAGKEAGKPER